MKKLIVARNRVLIRPGKTNEKTQSGLCSRRAFRKKKNSKQIYYCSTGIHFDAGTRRRIVV